MMVNILLTLVLLQAPVSPEPQVPPVDRLAEVRFEELVEELDSEDWNDREAATWKLARTTADIPDVWIERHLEQSGLSLEQVMRLLRVMEIRLLHAPRGALGIQMPLNQIGRPGELLKIDARGVQVSAVIPGLPAEQVLQAGDVITHIDEKALGHREDLARIVQQHWPGDVLKLRVLRTRPGQEELDPEDREVDRLEVEITLGSTTDLRRSGGAQSVLDPALADRRQRLAELLQKHGAVPSSIPAPLFPEIESMSSEEDPMIRGILQQLDAARNGTYTKTLPELKKQWTRQLASIDDTLARQDLQPKERAQLEHRREQLQIILDSLEMRRF
ncbi:MAG: PDZ domain-containing protein [Phycisphaerales bacterium]|nr:PDZ domain-containing protein [Phycisphaerales bacterium]